MASNSANPIFDALVSLFSGQPKIPSKKTLEEYHAILIELAKKEPGGFRRKLSDLKAVDLNTAPALPTGEAPSESKEKKAGWGEVARKKSRKRRGGGGVSYPPM